MILREPAVDPLTYEVWVGGVKPLHNLQTLLVDLFSFLALYLKYPCRLLSSKSTMPIVRNFTLPSFFLFNLLWKITSTMCVTNGLFEGQAWDTGVCRNSWPYSSCYNVIIPGVVKVTLVDRGSFLCREIAWIHTVHKEIGMMRSGQLKLALTFSSEYFS